jgi:hypothetical protein
MTRKKAITPTEPMPRRIEIAPQVLKKITTLDVHCCKPRQNIIYLRGE